jgi:hypothetical protein
MPRGAVRVTQGEIQRAFRAARAERTELVALEIRPDGALRLIFRAALPQVRDRMAEWEAKYGSAP